MSPSVIYLDSHHISRLVRDPTDADVGRALQLLRSGRFALGFSLMHLYELSAPSFISRPAVGAFLDTACLKWAVHLPELFDREIRSVFERVALGRVSHPRIFHDDVLSAWAMPDGAAIPPSEMLDVFSSRPDLRDKIAKTAGHGAIMDRLKTDAVVIRDPKVPLVSRLRDMLIPETPAGLILPVPYAPEELFDRAGGVPGFPAYNVFQSLSLTRLRDGGFAPGPTDIVDEWHACYLPYSYATALDRRTVGRCRSAKLPHIDRLAISLADLVPMLGRDVNDPA
jgi:hypothetical protein